MLAVIWLQDKMGSEYLYRKGDLTNKQRIAIRDSLASSGLVSLVPSGNKGQCYLVDGVNGTPPVGYIGSKYVRLDSDLGRADTSRTSIFNILEKILGSSDKRNIT